MKLLILGIIFLAGAATFVVPPTIDDNKISSRPKRMIKTGKKTVLDSGIAIIATGSRHIFGKGKLLS